MRGWAGGGKQATGLKGKRGESGLGVFFFQPLNPFQTLNSFESLITSNLLQVFKLF
jgi:hypothetical protein